MSPETQPTAGEICPSWAPRSPVHGTTYLDTTDDPVLRTMVCGEWLPSLTRRLHAGQATIYVYEDSVEAVASHYGQFIEPIAVAGTERELRNILHGLGWTVRRVVRMGLTAGHLAMDYDGTLLDD